MLLERSQAWDGRTFTAGLFSGSSRALGDGYQQLGTSSHGAVDTRATCKRPFCYLIDIGQPEVLLHKAGMFAAPRLGDGVDSLSERRNVSRRIGPGWLFRMSVSQRMGWAGRKNEKNNQGFPLLQPKSGSLAPGVGDLGLAPPDQLSQGIWVPEKISYTHQILQTAS